MNDSSGNESSTNYSSPELPLDLVVLTYGIIVLGFSGNGFICAAFVFNRKIRTVNNYFVFNLAVSDLLLIVSLCLVMVWPAIEKALPDEDDMKVIFSLIVFETFCGSASIANITVIGYDRYYAVKKPLHYSAHMTHRKAVVLIACIWCYSAVAALLQLISRSPDRNVYRFGYLPFLALCNVLIPLATTLYCYTSIFIIALGHLRNNPHRNLDASSAACMLSKNLKIALNIIALIVPLLVCWNIFYIITVVEHVCESCGDSSCCIPLTSAYSQWIISDMAHIVATFDPIVYICLTKDFRKIIFGWFRGRTRPHLVSETFRLSTTYFNNASNSPPERALEEIPQ